MTGFAVPKNDVSSTILAPGWVANSSTTLALSSGTGARFGSPTPTNPIYFTLVTAGTVNTAAETRRHFKATGRTSDTLTGVSILPSNTDDQGFSAGDTIAMRDVAEYLIAIHTAINSVETLADGHTTSIAANTSGIATNTSAISSLTTTVAGKAADSAVVHLTGAETVGGVKDFTSSPTVPTVSEADNSTKVASTAFVQALVTAAVAGLLDLKGSLDASTNPNYPAASKGDTYLISVVGKVGGASGKSVDVGDAVVASADNAGGTEASVGTSWFVLEHNLSGVLLAANNLSDLANAATARTNLGAAATSHTHTASDVTDFSTAADARIALKRGAANGIAPYDANSHIPLAAIPGPGVALDSLSGGPPDHYWDAFDLDYLDGATVTSWVDRNGGLTLVPRTGTITYIAASPELGGNPAIQCNASDLLTNSISFDRRSFTLVLVFFSHARADTNAFAGCGSDAYFNQIYGFFNFFDAQGSVGSGQLTVGYGQEAYVAIFASDATGCGWTINGLTSNTSAMSTKTYTTLVLGSDGSGALNWRGHIGLAALFKRRLSATEIGQATRNLMYRNSICRMPPVDKDFLGAVGDSITLGAYMPSLWQEWPEQIKDLLGFPVSVKNVARSGNVIGTLNLGALSPLLNTKRQHNMLCVMIGTNNTGTSGASNYSALLTVITGLRAAGWELYLATLPDCTTSYLPQATRDDYNAAIRTNWTTIADGIADVAADYRVGRTGANADTVYFNADGIHLVGPGDAVVAQCFASAIRQKRGLWPNTYGWTSTDNTDNVAVTIPLLNTQQYEIEIRAVARRMDSGSEWATFNKKYGVFVTGGAITASSELGAIADDFHTLSTATLTIANSGLNFQIKAKGETGKTLQWEIWVNVAKSKISGG